jgi:hypothetical protein
MTTPPTTEHSVIETGLVTLQKHFPASRRNTTMTNEELRDLVNELFQSAPALSQGGMAMSPGEVVMTKGMLRKLVIELSDLEHDEAAFEARLSLIRAASELAGFESVYDFIGAAVLKEHDDAAVLNAHDGKAH